MDILPSQNSTVEIFEQNMIPTFSDKPLKAIKTTITSWLKGVMVVLPANKGSLFKANTPFVSPTFFQFAAEVLLHNSNG